MKHFIVLLLFCSTAFMAQTKLESTLSTELISFTLFNYDNLIADSYEDQSPYMTQLAYLLGRATQVPESQYLAILNSASFKTESSPINYMMALNAKTKELSGYYFVDE